MPLKPGGGNHMQPYDPHTGEYTEQEKARMRWHDNFAISSFEWSGNDSKYIFHFPIDGVHERDYCERFVRSIRSDLREPVYVQSKMDYLLSYHERDDKSKFIKGLGYSELRPRQLFEDICENTKRESIEFRKFSYGVMLVEAKTIIRGKLVKTIWKIEKDLRIFFVTLIPGGDKLWKK